MKKNKLLLLSLLASTLLVGCDKDTFIKNGDDKVIDKITVSDKDGSETDISVDLTLQDLYKTLKTSSGGSKALEVLLEKIARQEYLDNTEKNIEVGYKTGTDEFDVRSYHTKDSFNADIAEVFEDAIEGTTYLDEDGKFDQEAFKEYVEETLDYETKDVTETSKYLSSDLQTKLGYNYDEYIEEDIIPSILNDYIYIDYVTSTSKYVSYFKSQYAINLEVLKISHDTSKLNSAWNEALIRNVKAVTSNAHTADTYKFAVSADEAKALSFVTFNSDNEMVLFEATENELTYSVYENTAAVQTLIDSMYVGEINTNINQVTVEAAKLAVASLTPVKTWKIDENTKVSNTPDGELNFYEKIEEVLIARNLWKIDREVVLAKNYDYKTSLYHAWTESEKNEAQGYSETYSSSNSKPIKQVAKERKISAQNTSFYTEADYYTKADYTSVLPTALSSLRGTNAQTLQNSLRSEFANGNVGVNYLLPNKDSIVDPVYLDTSSSTYYICQVNDYYGLYIDGTKHGAKNVSKSDYQIDAYRAGKYTYYGDYNETDKKFNEENVYFDVAPERFESIIELVQVSAKEILTDTIKKEAIVSLFEKYGLEINDQDVYDYISNQYPNYFKEEK